METNEKEPRMPPWYIVILWELLNVLAFFFSALIAFGVFRMVRTQHPDSNIIIRPLSKGVRMLIIYSYCILAVISVTVSVRDVCRMSGSVHCSTWATSIANWEFIYTTIMEVISMCVVILPNPFNENLIVSGKVVHRKLYWCLFQFLGLFLAALAEGFILWNDFQSLENQANFLEIKSNIVLLGIYIVTVAVAFILHFRISLPKKMLSYPLSNMSHVALTDYNKNVADYSLFLFLNSVSKPFGLVAMMIWHSNQYYFHQIMVASYTIITVVATVCQPRVMLNVCKFLKIENYNFVKEHLLRTQSTSKVKTISTICQNVENVESPRESPPARDNVLLFIRRESRRSRRPSIELDRISEVRA